MRERWLFLGLIALLGGAFLAALLFGSVWISPAQLWQILTRVETNSQFGVIFWQIRLPRACTALLAGIALGVSGLQMQTLFRNPLADPFVLGVNAGASLGVALVVLTTSGLLGTAIGAQFNQLGFAGAFGVALAASIGGGLGLLLILAVARHLSNVTLLLIGLMLSYLTGAGVSILLYFAIPARVQAYLTWTFGSFGGVTWRQLATLGAVLAFALPFSLRLARPMDAFLLGEGYANSLGVQVRSLRRSLVLWSAVLSGCVTAFCGPIGFIGLAVPHLGRNLFRTSSHRLLLPASCLLGGTLALLADLLAQLPGSQYALPLNAVTALLGAPIVLFVLLRGNGQFER